VLPFCRWHQVIAGAAACQPEISDPSVSNETLAELGGNGLPRISSISENVSRIVCALVRPWNAEAAQELAKALLQQTRLPHQVS
jgi:hypothetical protein